MFRKVNTIWVILILISTSIIILVEIAPIVQAPTTLYVGGSGGGNYSKIQWAIDNASDGDTVYVYNGTYYENLVVNKTINLIGEDKDYTIINGSGSGDVIRIVVDYVNISGFTTVYSGTKLSSPYDSGIELYMVSNSRIFNNNISYNTFGLRIYLSDNNFIAYNYFSINSHAAIYLDHSSNNTINENIVTKNQYSIYLINSNSNRVANHTMTENERGFDVYESSSNVIYNNNVHSFNRGIDLRTNSNENEIINNDFSNQLYGVFITGDSNKNVITNNTINKNYEHGIHVESSHYNSFTDNEISFNRRVGFYFVSSKGIILNRNTMLRNSILISGFSLDYWNTHDIDTSNTVNGKPVYYWKNQTGGVIPKGAGEVILANCTNVLIENQTLIQGSYGIILGRSSNNIIRNNLISSNTMHGIFICGSVLNEFTGNFIVYNWIGIYSMESNDNIFHHNNFLFNTWQVYITNSLNLVWDNGSEGNYWYDYTGLDDGSGGRTASDGVGDTEIPHPYTDQGYGYYQLDDYPLMNPTENYIILHEGWNLISIPLIQIEQNLTRVLSSIDGWYDAVQFYDSIDTNDHWKHNKIGKPFGNDLYELNESIGFWVHITQPGDTIFIYNGTQPSVNQTISLTTGWNLVGYPSLSNKNRTDALNNIDFGSDVDAIWTYNATTQTWKEITASDNFEVGMGYWIHSKVTKTWIVPL